MVPFESLGMVSESYSQSIASMAVSLAVSTQYTNVTDTRLPDRHRTTVKAALMHSIARQKQTLRASLRHVSKTVSAGAIPNTEINTHRLSHQNSSLRVTC